MINNDFVLLDTTTTLADIVNAVKMKWGYVTMTSVRIDVVTIVDVQKIKITLMYLIHVNWWDRRDSNPGPID